MSMTLKLHLVVLTASGMAKTPPVDVHEATTEGTSTKVTGNNSSGHIEET